VRVVRRRCPVAVAVVTVRGRHVQRHGAETFGLRHRARNADGGVHVVRPVSDYNRGRSVGSLPGHGFRGTRPEPTSLRRARTQPSRRISKRNATHGLTPVQNGHKLRDERGLFFFITCNETHIVEKRFWATPVHSRVAIRPGTCDPGFVTSVPVPVLLNNWITTNCRRGTSPFSTILILLSICTKHAWIYIVYCRIQTFQWSEHLKIVHGKYCLLQKGHMSI